MNCPYCNRHVFGMTGLQEAQKFAKHLATCRKNPNNIVLSDGNHSAVQPVRRQNLLDALEIRAESGQ